MQMNPKRNNSNYGPQRNLYERYRHEGNKPVNNIGHANQNQHDQYNNKDFQAATSILFYTKGIRRLTALDPFFL